MRNVATDGMTPERGRYVGRSALVFFAQTLVQMITMLMLPAAAVALIRASGVAASAQDDVDIPASLAAGIQPGLAFAMTKSSVAATVAAVASRKLAWSSTTQTRTRSSQTCTLCGAGLPHTMVYTPHS
jgi:hypothetical protein